MENYKENIIASRVGSLGSSDAAMVEKVGKTGKLSYADRERLAVLTGQAEQRDFSNAATRNGDYIEQEIFKEVAEKWPQAKSNPAFASPALSTKHFTVLNHIDIEVLKDNFLVWYEIKASRYSTEQVKEEYAAQLRWHYMLLKEKAALLGLTPVLVLVHYKVESYDAPYDPARLANTKVSFKGDFAADIKKGLELIDAELAGGFTWTPREELDASELPDALAQKFTYIQDRLREAEAIKAEVETFKSRLLELCLEKGVRSIKSDEWTATVKEGYTQSRLDSKKLEREHPEIYSQCLSSTAVRPSITIKLK